jgi:hypothetical protein
VELKLGGLLILLVATAPGQTNSSAAVAESRIIPPAAHHVLPEDETLVFSVQWHMLNAGTTTILLRNNGRAEHLTSTADTEGFTNKIFPVHDIFQADFDPRTFCTAQIVRHAEEGPRRLNRRVFFDYPRAKSTVDEEDLKSGRSKHAEFDIPPCVTDVVSGFFYAGSLDLTPGYTQTFPVNDGGKTTDVKIEVEARESVKVPAGSFATIRVRVQPVSGPLKGSLWVWLTDDSRHLPVQMRSKLGFATLFFQLQRIEAAAR